MLRRFNIILAGVIVLGAATGTTRILASPITDALVSVADELASTQKRFGGLKGSWPDEADYTGTILAGMAKAYDDTCDNDYPIVLTRAGNYILDASGGLFYGEEAYSLALLGDMEASYRTAVEDFFYTVKYDSPSGTEAFFENWENQPVATTLIDFAHYSVAAYAVDADDKALWRQEIVNLLRRLSDEVDDEHDISLPVAGLAIATWGLAMTGPMDDTLIDPNGTGDPRWWGVTLADLPMMVADYQVPVGEVGEGSFYWRLDKTNGGEITWPFGYTEDSIFGTLALIACREQLGVDLDVNIARAFDALLNGIQTDGTVLEHLYEGSIAYAAYGGEMANVLGEMTPRADLDLDGRVDGIDYSLLMNNWGSTQCTGCSWCEGADIDRNGVVDFSDLEIFAGTYWLAGANQ